MCEWMPPTASSLTAWFFAVRQASRESRSCSASRSTMLCRAKSEAARAARPEDWEPKTLDELGGAQLELLSDSGEDGVMSLAFLISGGAVASILRSPSPVASPKGPAAAASPKSSDGDSPPDASDVLAPELVVRLVEPASL